MDDCCFAGIDVPEQEWMPEQLATIGEVFLEVTRILARRWRNLQLKLQNIAYSIECRMEPIYRIATISTHLFGSGINNPS